MSFTGHGQVWPVDVYPSINMPYPACLADYANDQPSGERMQLSLLLRDITVSPIGTPESPAELAEEKGKPIVVTFANAGDNESENNTAFCAFDPIYNGTFNNGALYLFFFRAFPSGNGRVMGWLEQPIKRSYAKRDS
jgi:hypothetical protein